MRITACSALHRLRFPRPFGKRALAKRGSICTLALERLGSEYPYERKLSPAARLTARADQAAAKRGSDRRGGRRAELGAHPSLPGSVRLSPIELSPRSPIAGLLRPLGICSAHFVPTASAQAVAHWLRLDVRRRRPQPQRSAIGERLQSRRTAIGDLDLDPRCRHDASPWHRTSNGDGSGGSVSQLTGRPMAHRFPLVCSALARRGWSAPR